MRSILTRLTKLKTYKKRVFKVLSLILSTLFLLVSFFASSRSVYASSDNDLTSANVSVSASQGSVIYSGFTVTGSNDNGSVYSGYFDFYIPINLSYYISAVPDNEYYGTIETSATLGLSRNISQVGPFAYFGLIDYSIVDNDKNFDIWASNASYFDNTHSSGSQNYYFYYYLDGSSGFVGVKYINIILHIREYWYDSAGHGINDYTDYVPTVSVYGFSSSYSNIQYRRSERYVLGNISDKLDGIGTINGNLQTIDNHLTTDNSQSSSNLNDRIDEYDTAESLASSSMAGALPDASTQLSSITSYDYEQLYSGNVSAFSFWRSLGDFVLSNSNLVGIGALLILILFAGMVVFLLRL